MTKDHISSRDMEILSAFVDGQLNSKEQARLDARLRDEPELQAVIDEFRQVRNGLQAMPKVRVPRNFTLTPAMAGIKQHRLYSLFTFSRFISAIASLLFIFVVIGDFVGIGNGSSNILMSVPVSNEVQDMVLEKEAQPIPEADLQTENAEEMPVEAPAAEAFAVEIETLAEDEMEGAGDEVQSRSAPEDEMGGVPPEEEPLFMEAPPMEEAQSMPDDCWVSPDDESAEKRELSPDCDDIDAVVEEESEMIQEDIELETQPDEVNQVAQESPQNWSVFRVLEVVFGLIAVLTGGMAWFFYRRSNG
jgi:hypothetical protein